GEVTPASFSHPLLASVKVVPQPVAVEETKTDAVPVQMPVKSVQADASTAPTNPETNDIDTKILLRSTVGHVDNVKTADASGALLSSSGMSNTTPVSELGP